MDPWDKHSSLMKTWVAGTVVVLGLLAAGAVFIGTRRGGGTSPSVDRWLADVTDDVGLNFVHDAGDVSKWEMPQIHGSGVAVFDCDGDGRLDVYVLNFGGPDSRSVNRLYKNMPDGTFRDITAGSGLGIAGYNTGVIVGDINNDGKPDVVVTQYRGVQVAVQRSPGGYDDGSDARAVLH